MYQNNKKKILNFVASVGRQFKIDINYQQTNHMLCHGIFFSYMMKDVAELFGCCSHDCNFNPPHKQLREQTTKIMTGGEKG